MKPHHNLPVFALDPSSTWNDLENAIEACVQYQSAKIGKIRSVMLFAPMTEPENPDTWQPMKVLPENLLLISIERSWDALILKAFARARDVLGQSTAVFPSVWSNPQALIADMYSQMAKAGMVSYREMHDHKDDLSFSFYAVAKRCKPSTTRFAASPKNKCVRKNMLPDLCRSAVKRFV